MTLSALLQESLDDLRFSEDFGEQELQRDRLLKLEMRRLYDDAHAALTEHTFDAVPTRKDCADLYSTGNHHERCTFCTWWRDDNTQSTT